MIASNRKSHRKKVDVENFDSIFNDSDYDMLEQDDSDNIYDGNKSSSDSSDSENVTRSNPNINNDANIPAVAGADSGSNSDNDPIPHPVQPLVPPPVPMNVDIDTWPLVTPDNGGYISLWCPQYIERSAPTIPQNVGQSNQPIEYFMLLFPQEAFELIANNTNDNATKFLDTLVDLTESSRFRQWADREANDIEAYVGLQICMELYSKPKIDD